MFNSQEYELYLKKMEQKREVSRVGNAIGGGMLISSGFAFVLNFIAVIILQILGKADIINDAGMQLTLQLIFSTLIFTLPILLIPLFAKMQQALKSFPHLL